MAGIPRQIEALESPVGQNSVDRKIDDGDALFNNGLLFGLLVRRIFIVGGRVFVLLSPFRRLARPVTLDFDLLGLGISPRHTRLSVRDTLG